MEENNKDYLTDKDKLVAKLLNDAEAYVNKKYPKEKKKAEKKDTKDSSGDAA
jgi:hypothetical protein